MAGRLFFAGTAALTALALAATPAFGSELDRACTRDVIAATPAAAVRPDLEVALEAIFDANPAPSIETADGLTGFSETMEVLVVRIENGKPVIGCVDTKEAARRFLTAPAVDGKAEEK